VVQETWIAVLGGLTGFQGRSSLRTWVFRVLINTAKVNQRVLLHRARAALRDGLDSYYAERRD